MESQTGRPPSAAFDEPWARPHGHKYKDGLNRKMRRAKFAQSMAKIKTTLDFVNDVLAKEDRYLHPTRGFKRLSPVRSMAGMIVAAIKEGQRMPLHMQREAMQHARRVAA